MKPRHAGPVEHARAPGLVLDAGALRALEGRHVALAVALGTAHRLGVPIFIPANALAQVWRGGPRSAPLARLLKQLTSVVTVDEREARHIGEFVAMLRFPAGMRVDVVDAHVALTTLATRSLVWTSDTTDLERYGVDPRRIRKV